MKPRTIKAKTPKGAARELARYLKTQRPDAYIRVNGATVICEEFTFEWPSALSGGSCPYAWETGNYSRPGPFPEGLMNDLVFGEADNHYSMTFHKR